MTSTPQNMNIRVFLSACTVFLAIATPSEGQLVDNFNYANNAALEAVWGAPTLGGDNADSFTYSTGAGELNATSLIDSTTTGGFGTTIFSRPVSHSGDLHATMEFNWNQTTNALGAMFLELRGPSGLIASGGMGDDTQNAAFAYMQIGGGTTFLGPNGSYVGGANTFENQTGAIATNLQGVAINALGPLRAANILGVDGSARLDILRFGDQIRLRIDNGINVFSLGPITGPTDDITSVELKFAAFRFAGGPANALVGDAGGHIGVSSVSLATPNAPGDTNGDGVVDINDYLLIRQNSFTSQPLGQNGDTNYDGFVDFTDFQIWKANFPGGAAAANAAIAAIGVPEPNSICLIGMGIGMFLFGSARRRNR